MKTPPWLNDSVAPNGRLVAQNVDDWFQGSKVVSIQHEPLLVYHGTSSDIDQFSASCVGSRHVDLEVGECYYFTDDHRTAIWYAKSASKQSKDGGHVMPVYLSLKNPLIVDFQETGIETLAEDIEEAKSNGHDGLISLNYDDGGVSNHYIAFSPNQIKSAIGNSGIFLPGSSSMSAPVEIVRHDISDAAIESSERAKRALDVVRDHGLHCCNGASP